MDFENDLEALESTLLEIDQRINKLEEHKKSANKELRKNMSDNGTIAETLRRLERNIANLYKKQEFLINERDSKSLTSDKI